MNTLLADLRYAIRILRKNPGFTLVTVVTLALGIGANTAIFSVVHAILLRPLPYKDAQRLVVIWETEPSGPGNLYPDTAPDFQDWRKQSKVFESMAAATTSGAALTGISEPLQLQGWEVSPEIFQVLGVRPLLGRTFTAGETGHNRVVILNYGLWQRAFGGDRTLVGRKISLDGEGYDVVGVMPRSFKFPQIWGQRSEFWRPISLDDAKWKQSRGNQKSVAKCIPEPGQPLVLGPGAAERRDQPGKSKHRDGDPFRATGTAVSGHQHRCDCESRRPAGAADEKH